MIVGYYNTIYTTSIKRRQLNNAHTHTHTQLYWNNYINANLKRS